MVEKGDRLYKEEFSFPFKIVYWYSHNKRIKYWIEQLPDQHKQRWSYV